MTNSESLFQFGSNAYAKPATGLNILRETIMGRELFDYAFKEYTNRWKFKHPTPSDFFRTMEDASAVDLDWFWRGWFYTIDHTDQAIASVKYLQLDTKDPIANSNSDKAERERERENISVIRNREEIKQTLNELDPSIDDYYTNYDPLDIDEIDIEDYEQYRNSLTQEEKDLLDANKHFYQIEIENKGGLIMPIIIEFEYEDHTTEVKRIPAEIWRFSKSSVTKSFSTDKKVVNITLDPFLETADIDTSNNSIQPETKPSRFDIYKNNRRNRNSENPMQRSIRAKEKINQP